MHQTVTVGSSAVGDLILYSAPALITLLLLVLTLRAARLPGSSSSNITFAVCALLWSFGGLFYTALRTSGVGSSDWTAQTARAIQYTGAAAFPIPVLRVWRRFAPKVQAGVFVEGLAYAAAIGIAVLAVVAPRTFPLRSVTIYSAATLLTLGAALLLRRSSAPRTVFTPSIAIVLSVVGAAVAMTITVPDRSALDHAFYGLGLHLIMLVVLCAFVLFARFRYADVFIRYGVRILLAAVWASTLILVVQMFFASAQHASPLGHTLFAIIASNLLLLSFTFLDQRVSDRLSRWLFHSADYRAIARRVSDQIRSMQGEGEIATTIEAAARETLELRDARVVSAEAGMLEGEIVELTPEEVLVPIASEGRITHALRIGVGASRPALVSDDLNFLRMLAAQCGSRFDALRREREAAERESREALLRQQVSEAELRALRAQINPHFLFNSLNTIADLVAVDPAAAEAMTLQLAGVFRHVLAHSARPLTPLRDEVSFLRTYLSIEQVRFRDRLRIEFDVAEEVESQQVPSLILQPIVENALKHGVGPKPGPGCVWIRAFAQGDHVRIVVEDDGMGPQNGSGLGLTNVSERLRTLYQDSAGVRLEAREGGGTIVTIWLPRSEIS